MFELFDATGEFRAICGGGRYDNLLAGVRRRRHAGLGFGMGDVVLGELLRARGLMPRGAQDRLLGRAGHGHDRLHAVHGCHRAAQGRRGVEYPLREQALGKQLKAAATPARHE